MLIMHSKTSVEKVEKNQVVKSVEVSKGEEKTRTIADNDSSKWGFHWKGEYFDCEADAARRNHQMGQHFQRVLVPEGVDHVRWELRVNHSRPFGQGTALWVVRKLQQEQMG